MPISSPSYFPSVRGTDQIVGINAGVKQTGARVFLAGLNTGNNSTVADIVLIGDSIYTNGVTDANLAKSTVVGSGSLSLVTTPVTTLPNTALGASIAPLATKAGGNTFVGDSIFAGYTTTVGLDLTENTVVGEGVMIGVLNAASIQKNVLIGARIGELSGGFGMGRCVIIGYQALRSVSWSGSGSEQSIYIGANIAPQYSSGFGGGKNTVIGTDAAQQFQSGLNNVAIGDSCEIGQFNARRNTVIGALASIGNGTGSGSQNVVIGFNAGRGLGAGDTDRLVIETGNGGGIARTLLFGDFLNGNLVLGESTAGNRAMVGTNTVKLLNGAAGGTPTGGGYLYVAAGALHWKGSTGTDTIVAPA